MADYSKEELQQLIDRYNRDLMEQYMSMSENGRSDPEIALPPSTETEETSLLTDVGQLQIRVSTENQAIPIVGAVVTITSEESPSSPWVLITDQSGLSPIIDLPAKDRRLSLTPDNPSPYASYDVTVTADGYFSKQFLSLPIYGGVTAIQNVSMIPLPEGGDNDIPLVYEEAIKE